MASNEEIEAVNDKSRPRLAMLGKNSLAAKQFALLVDKRVIGRYSSFPFTLSMLFCSFYMLNIEYPVEAAATLEFIQRCFVGINPGQGVKTSERKKASCVDALVLKVYKQT